jgi:hypothetical protein
VNPGRGNCVDCLRFRSLPHIHLRHARRRKTPSVKKNELPSSAPSHILNFIRIWLRSSRAEISRQYVYVTVSHFKCY